MFQNKNKPKTCLIILVVALFWGVSYISSDPDFGWHLKMGELIRGSGIPSGDPFSYTMPSYPFVDHEWLTNVLISKLFPVIGKAGLAAVSSVIVVAALLVSSANPLSIKIKKSPIDILIVFIVLILGFSTVFPFVGVRPQVQSWLFLAVLLRIVLVSKTWQKWRYMIPPLILVWTNLHGSFAVAPIVLGFVVALRTISRKKLRLDEVAIVIASLLATLVNPYGWRVWWEIKQQMTDSNLRWNIGEWRPMVLSGDYSFSVLATLSSIFIFKFRNKFKLEELGLYLGFLAQALLSSRHVPLWVVVTLPMTIGSMRNFYQEVEAIPLAKQKLKKAAKGLALGVLIIFIVQTAIRFKSARSMKESFYPTKATQYLHDNPPVGEIFSRYGWGGYLIWNLPEKKVFVDGRMPSWRYNDAPEGESNYVFRDYLDVLSGDIDYKLIINKHGIDTVLLPIPTESGKTEELSMKIMTFFGKEKKDYSLAKQLEEGGWDKTYEDSVAVIYQKSR